MKSDRDREITLVR